MMRKPSTLSANARFRTKPRKVVARVLGKEESSSRSPKKLMNCGKRATVTNVVSKNVYRRKRRKNL
jgi:hypothetical protein